MTTIIAVGLVDNGGKDNETDSYAAVLLLEQNKNLGIESVKSMAESVCDSFVFIILRDDNILFLVRGNNPVTLYHFPKLGLYVYASTIELLELWGYPTAEIMELIENDIFEETVDEIKSILEEVTL